MNHVHRICPSGPSGGWGGADEDDDDNEEDGDHAWTAQCNNNAIASSQGFERAESENIYIYTYHYISMFENIDRYIVYMIQIYTRVFGVNGSAVAWTLGCLAGSPDGWMACAFKSICTL